MNVLRGSVLSRSSLYFFLISMSQKWNWRASRGRLFALMIYDNLQRKVHFTLNLLIFEDAC